MRRATAAAPLVAAIWAGAAGAQGEPVRPESALEERVDVRLVELKITARDRHGRPVTDLRPDEVVVLEGDEPQRIAYLEVLSEGPRESAVGPELPPSPLYDEEGRTDGSAEPPVVPPPPPARRVILAFDASNSKRRVRDEWKRAAREWVETSMRPEDRVAVVVLRRRLDWAQGLTGDAQALARVVDYLDLETNLPNRDRREDVSRMISELEPCNDVSGAPPSRRRSQAGTPSPATVSTGAVDCSITVAESWVAQWAAESEESIDLLRTLTGQLSAMPGRKEVVLFSEGIIPDASSAGTDVMLAVFGDRSFNLMSLQSRFGKESLRALSELHSAARAADVVFFTLDTRSGADRGYSDDLERAQPLAANRLGINPWAEMYDATSGTLEVLADETGGRSFFGRDDLTDRVRRAADDFFAIYTLGYYRDEATEIPRKVRVKVLRKGVKLEYSGKTAPPRRPPQPVRLDLSIGRPELTGDAERQQLPVRVQVAMEQLPMRRAGLIHGCELGVWVQAITPEGVLAGEVFEPATAAVEDRDEQIGRAFRHAVRLDLPPGSYRIRARVSDDRQQVLGERVVDLTLTMGGVRAGLVPPEPEESE